jgi:hypothetical protein
MQTQMGATATGGDAVAILINDHERIKDLFERLLNSDAAGRPQILKQLKPLLVIHNAGEENVVYPAIAELAERPIHANRLYHQQDEAQVAFWELLELDPGDAKFFRKTADLRDALLAHVREEEEHEFAHLRESLEPEKMQKLTADLREFRSEFGAAKSPSMS